MTLRGVWKVLYADWQMECCGTPFAVGDEVTWPLLVLSGGGDGLYGMDGMDGWQEDFSEIEGPVVALDSLPGDWLADDIEDEGDEGDEADEGDKDDEGDEEPWEASVVRAHGVTVPWNHAPPRPARTALRGLLSVERHGGRWPDTVGRVRTIHVVTQGFAETTEGSGTYAPVPGERWLRPV
ncbi:DUF6578 domain-containing protein, partial [Streptomyces kanamyceticus]